TVEFRRGPGAAGRPQTEPATDRPKATSPSSGRNPSRRNPLDLQSAVRTTVVFLPVRQTMGTCSQPQNTSAFPTDRAALRLLHRPEIPRLEVNMKKPTSHLNAFQDMTA